MPETVRSTQVAVVGAGPRGIALAWLLLDPARRPSGEVRVHLIDPNPGGAVWSTDQDVPLLMNSRARQATLFADDSVPGVHGPPRGPSFIEWCRQLAPTLDLPSNVAAEAAAMNDDSFARRRLFGYYTRWAVAELGRRSPDLTIHSQRVRDIEDGPGGVQRLRLDGAGWLEVDAVVLALGHLPSSPGARERERTDFARRHSLTYVAPQPATAATVAELTPGTRTALLGAGLNFYDVMALVTEGRDGVYSAQSDGSLHYQPSGEEPILLIGSGRGIPYMARSRHPRPVHFAVCTDETRSRWLRSRGTLSFRRDVWPLLVAELDRTWRENGGAGELDVEGLLDPFAARSEQVAVGSVETLTATLREVLVADVTSAGASPRGAATAIGETLAALKDMVRGLTAVGAFDGASVRDDLQGWFRSAGAYVAAGPPLERVRQAIALIDAGLLHAIGARSTCRLDEEAGAFVISSRELAEPIQVTALVEARLAEEDIRHTADELVTNLLRRGLARTVTIPADTGPVAFGGFEVVRTTELTLADATACRLVDAGGSASRRRFLIGLPVQPQEWNIANLPQPARGDRLFVQAGSVIAQIKALRQTRTPTSTAQLDLENSSC